MICILNQNANGYVEEIILRKPTLSDRLAVLFLRKGRDIVFTNPVPFEGESNGTED